MLRWLRRWFNRRWFNVTAIGGVAAGRDISGSAIATGDQAQAHVHHGLNEEKTRDLVAEAQRPMAEQLAALAIQLAREKGVEAAPLRAVLEKLGEIGVPDHEIPTRLAKAADQLVELRNQLARLSNDRPELAAIRQQALALIDQGNLDGARAALNRGREVARSLRQEASRNEAEFLADEARIDHLQLAYRAAAEKYAEAAALVRSFDREGQWRFLMKEASERHDYGLEFGDNGALATAIAIYKQALTLVPRERVPFDWAGTQNSLGGALLTLGERESGSERLEEAVEAFCAALEEWTRERVPLDWALTQTNLGLVLLALGQRESGTGRLEEAVEAFRAALEERTRERAPLEWATSLGSQGVALVLLAERRQDLRLAEMAVSQLEAAYTLFRDSGHAPNAAYYEAQLQKARALCDRLKSR